MTRDVFVFVECKGSVARKASLELLSMGRKITERFSSTLYAVLIGSGVREVAETLKEYADRIVFIDSGELKDYGWDTYGSALEQILKKYDPMIVFGTSSMIGKDLFPRVAARFQAAMISEAVGIDFHGESVKIRKPLFGGKVLSWLAPKDGSMLFATFRPNSFAIENDSAKGEIVEENVKIEKDQRIKTISFEKSESKKVDIQEADFIICGGRGMKGPEHFSMLEEIADMMGGCVGASRTVVDSKWRQYDEQIGKSGKTVSPKLYIGCGISGALHHIMGMDTSKVIVAVNKDQNAPIFQYADYGIVDDLFEVLPALKDELNKAREDS